MPQAPQRLRLVTALSGVGAGKVSAASYGGLESAAWHAESTLIGLRALAGRRSAQGWEAVQMVDSGLSQAQIAAELQISRSAVSQRLAKANWDEVRRLAEVAGTALAAAMESGR